MYINEHDNKSYKLINEQKSFDHHNICRKQQNPACLHDENPRESRTKKNIHQHNGYIRETLSQHRPKWRETEAILLKSGT